MSKAIEEALSKLDPSNDNHWTGDGLPRLETMRILSGNPGLSRDDLNAAVPGFTRPKAAAPAAPQAPAAQGEGGSSTPPVAAAPAAPQPPAPPAPAVEEPELALALNPKLAESDELADLRNELETLQLNYSEAVVLDGRVKERLHDLQNAMDAINDKIVKLSEKTEGNPIMQYLAQQRRDLEARGERMKAIQQSGLRLGELAASLRAPIDSSFKTRRRR